MIRSRVVALLVLGSLILAVAGQSSAQVRYVDEQGNPHWVQGPGWAPERYRDKASQPALPKLRSGDVIGNERIPEGPTAAEQTAARVREHNVNVQRLIQERAMQGRTNSDFAAQLQERDRQLGVLAEDAAQRRVQQEIKMKEDREERRADESLRLQQQSVDLQRQELDRLNRSRYR